MALKPTVLVVEDEPMLLLMAGDVVREAGMEPLFARDAAAAVLILEDRSDIRIVFTDVDMPGSMDGIKLAAFVRGRWPPIEIIVVSGYRSVDPSELPQGSYFFQKPYDSGQLVDTLIQIAA